MNCAYIICFVALLQVSTYATFAVAETTTAENNTEIFPNTETMTEDTNTTAVTVTELGNGTETTTESAEAGEEVETFSYTAATETTTVKVEQSTATMKPTPGSAALVHPSVLAIIVPVGFRLFSTRLVGVV